MVDRGTLEEAGHAQGAQGWLNVSLQTTRGTEQLYSLLQQYVQKPAFLHKLTAARSAAGGPAAPVPVAILDAEQSSAPTCPEHMHPDDDVMQASFWEPVPEPYAHEVWSQLGMLMLPLPSVKQQGLRHMSAEFPTKLCKNAGPFYHAPIGYTAVEMQPRGRWKLSMCISQFAV